MSLLNYLISLLLKPCHCLSGFHGDYEAEYVNAYVFHCLKLTIISILAYARNMIENYVPSNILLYM